MKEKAQKGMIFSLFLFLNTSKQTKECPPGRNRTNLNKSEQI